MIIPISTLGAAVLRRETEEIDKDYPKLGELIENMFETMHKAEGIGLAAPQINRAIRLFVIDGSVLEEEENLADFKKVFINPVILSEEGEAWAFSEGCLSVPYIQEVVYRKPIITIEYYDENFNFHRETYDGLKARIIQHEYDHLEGIIFTDKISPLKKRLLRNKLAAITKGKVATAYKVRSAN